MSAILGIFTTAQDAASDVEVHRGLAPMARRGGELVDIWREPGAVLAVSRHEWELGYSHLGPVGVAHDERAAVVADAAIYYQDDLRRALRAKGVEARGRSVSELVLAAYRAWGEECASHLEGDFTFIVWDRVERRVTCARDFAGMRSLYIADLGNTLIVASMMSAITAMPRCPRDMNVFALGNTVARLFAASHETCYRAIRSVLAGESMSWRPGVALRVWRHWEPPMPSTGKGPKFEEAAEQLRALITAAISERLPTEAPAAVWLSGGYDSTSLFALGQQLLRDRGEPGERIRAVSMSYPDGDPGNEDDRIKLVAEFWKQPVTFVHSDDVPMWGDDEARAARRDDSFAHPFERWQRAMGSASRSVGARVALQGIGGDELFSGTDLYLADMFRTGRWIALAREWNERVSHYGFRFFVRQAVIPTMSPRMRTIVGRLRGGKPLKDPYEFAPPDWMRPEFVRQHQLVEREREYTPKLDTKSLTAQQVYQCIVHPAFGVIRTPIFDFGVEEGLEIRIPLYDRRVVEFSAPRPATERLSGTESKRLLRRAVQGLLPDSVLAPRKYRTGVTTMYVDRWMRREPPKWFDDILADSLLAQIGMVDQDALRRAWKEYQASGDNVLGTRLFATFETELWLRTHEGAQHLASRPAGRNGLGMVPRTPFTNGGEIVPETHASAHRNGPRSDAVDGSDRNERQHVPHDASH